MGGGVMRTATKAAALGAYRPALGRTGRRSTVPAPPPSATAPVADSAPIALQIDESKGLNESAISQWDDWEFAGWKSEGEDLCEDPPPRLVFSPVPPTLDEAQEATKDLTRALESVNEPGQMGIFPNNALLPAMPVGVSQAFSLLQSSPEAQSVVASLATDKNVWDAVLKNEKVMEFCRNHQTSFPEKFFEESFNNNQENGAETHSEAADAPNGSNGFTGFVNNVKGKAMDFVNNISNFIQDIFGMKAGSDSSEAEAGSSSTFQSFITPTKSFYALAIAVILIVLVKRV
ncbi:Bifunctional protein HldE [Rhynchospora pubera]|uniref:Bifunctional protein HldE n=1 Tax=Rhynchospora pubera TaxID=906938 RepID=A0AAV8D9X8_9POAL|nr:Bifunctional protein HldE [Rhynchospora pubera]